MISICNYCKGEFEQDDVQLSRRKIYCSDQCRHDQHNLYMKMERKAGIKEKVCALCQTKFMPKTRSKNKVYCSYGCYCKVKTMRKKTQFVSPTPVARECTSCRKTYMATRPKSQYCSSYCRVKFAKTAFSLGLSVAELQAMPQPEPIAVNTEPVSGSMIPPKETHLCIRCKKSEVPDATVEYCDPCVYEMQRKVEQETIARLTGK